MEKINFSDLNLEIEKGFKEIEFNGHKLYILKYLPCADKYELLMTTLREAYDDGVYHPFRLEVFFNLNLAIMYCANIEYSDEDTENPIIMYDKLYSCGLLDSIIDAIEDNEYEELWNTLIELVDTYSKYETSFMGIFNRLETEIPTVMEQFKNLTQNFDMSKLTEVVNFAAAANGNRPIEDE